MTSRRIRMVTITWMIFPSYIQVKHMPVSVMRNELGELMLK